MPRRPIGHAASSRLGPVIFLVAFLLPWFAGAGVRTLLAQPRREVPVTDEAVKQAIARGVEFIWSKQTKEGHWETRSDAEWNAVNRDPARPSADDLNRGGLTALALLGLINGGVDPNDPRFVKGYKWLAEQNAPGTYTRGLRGALWCAIGKKAYKLLEEDALFLQEGIYVHGTYTYSPRPVKDTRDVGPVGDFSNTQYGVLGVWSGSEGGVEIHPKYWRLIQHGYLWGQQLDGGWRYPVVPEHKAAGPDSYPGSRDALTLGGVATLFVVWDKLYAGDNCDARVDPELVSSINRALTWLGKHFSEQKKKGMTYIEPYTLYALERGGVASGLKYLGKFDWSLEGSRLALAGQSPDGSWPTGHHLLVAGTSWTITFLVYGRAPLVFNKLAHDKAEDWNARPRDVANLTRWMTGQFEKKLNWQIVPIDSSAADLQDAPVLYITGKKAVAFKPEQKAMLKNFVLQGGTILASPSGSGGDFSRGMQALMRELFPERELVPLPADSPLYTTPTKFAAPPNFLAMSNGIRWFVLISSMDLGCPWQQLQFIRDRNAFTFACNLYAYVSDNGQLKGRGQSYLVADAGNKPATTMTIGRLMWGSPAQCDPEPAAWTIQDIKLRNANVMGLNIVPTDLAEPLDPVKVPLLHLTGVGPPMLADQAKANLKAYLQGGGVLLADAAGGSPRFTEGFFGLMDELIGPNPLAPASALLPFVAEATDGGKVWFRHRFGLPKSSRPLDLLVARSQQGQPGRVSVVFVPYDLSAAMVGYPSQAPAGFTHESADRFTMALLKWRAGMSTPTSQPATQPAMQSSTQPSSP